MLSWDWSPQNVNWHRDPLSTYVGHIVSEEGVRTDSKKLQAVSEYPTPTDVKSLRSFLGLASYYRKFIPNFVKTTGPLYVYVLQLKRMWSSCGPHNFRQFWDVEELLTSAPVLAFPDFSIPFILETDVSSQGLDAMLAQQQSDKLVRPLLMQADAYNLMRGIMELLNLRTLGSCGYKIYSITIW